MSIVLKPAGIVAALIILGYMVFTILAYTKDVQSLNAAHGSTPELPGDTRRRQLTNGGFENPFGAVRIFGNPPDSKAKLSGELASGWEDNSNWATATITYSPDTNKPHSGGTSQRIGLKTVGKQGDGAQVCQALTAYRGKVYRASAWFRARSSTEATLTIRPLGENLRVKETSRKLAVGTDWRQVSIELDARDMTKESADTLLIIGIYTPNRTLWVDDVEFSETRKN